MAYFDCLPDNPGTFDQNQVGTQRIVRVAASRISGYFHVRPFLNDQNLGLGLINRLGLGIQQNSNHQSQTETECQLLINALTGQVN